MKFPMKMKEGLLVFGVEAFAASVLERELEVQLLLQFLFMTLEAPSTSRNFIK